MSDDATEATTSSIALTNNNNTKTPSMVQDANGENKSYVDSIVEALRIKLEVGNGECIYKLSDPREYLHHYSFE